MWQIYPLCLSNLFMSKEYFTYFQSFYTKDVLNCLCEVFFTPMETPPVYVLLACFSKKAFPETQSQHIPLYARVKCGKWGKNEEHLRCIKFATGWTVTLTHWAAVKQGLTTYPLYRLRFPTLGKKTSPHPTPPPPPKKNYCKGGREVTWGKSWGTGVKAKGEVGSLFFSKKNNTISPKKTRGGDFRFAQDVLKAKPNRWRLGRRPPLTRDIDSLLSVNEVSHCLTSSPTPKVVSRRMRNVEMLKDGSSTVGNNPPSLLCWAAQTHWTCTCITPMAAQGHTSSKTRGGTVLSQTFRVCACVFLMDSSKWHFAVYWNDWQTLFSAHCNSCTQRASN